MNRKKIIVTAAAMFVIGVAFAAQPIAKREKSTTDMVQQIAPWVPGTYMLMSAHEPATGLAPPR